MANLQVPPNAEGVSASAVVIGKVLMAGVTNDGRVSVNVKGTDPNNKEPVEGWFWTDKNTAAILSASLVALQQNYDVWVIASSTANNSYLDGFYVNAHK